MRRPSLFSAILGDGTPFLRAGRNRYELMETHSVHENMTYVRGMKQV